MGSEQDKNREIREGMIVGKKGNCAQRMVA